VKKIANRVLEATSGDHPAGSEGEVERLIRQYPDKSQQPAEAPAEPVNADAKKDGIK
jgi:hypothetical protein